ncbi:hypothetical protein ACSMXN_16205 [Jatrophihabitans sp. DSM 45814]
MPGTPPGVPTASSIAPTDTTDRASGVNSGRARLSLLVGVCLILLLGAGGAVARKDAAAKHARLRAICESAAVAVANSVPSIADVHGSSNGSSATSDQLTRAIDAYLDNSTAAVRPRMTGRFSAGGTSLMLTCRQHVPIRFWGRVTKSYLVEQTASASAPFAVREG